jgi:hypothetical protein
MDCIDGETEDRKGHRLIIYFSAQSLPTRPDADAMSQPMKTPMEDTRQNEELLNAAAGRPRRMCAPL